MPARLVQRASVAGTQVPVGRTTGGVGAANERFALGAPSAAAEARGVQRAPIQAGPATLPQRGAARTIPAPAPGPRPGPNRARQGRQFVGSAGGFRLEHPGLPVGWTRALYQQPGRAGHSHDQSAPENLRLLSHPERVPDLLSHPQLPEPLPQTRAEPLAGAPRCRQRRALHPLSASRWTLRPEQLRVIMLETFTNETVVALSAQYGNVWEGSNDAK